MTAFSPTLTSWMRRPGGRATASLVLVLIATTAAPSRSSAADLDRGAAARQFHERIEPVLEEHCSGCHGNGLRKGGVALDGFASDDALLARRDLWWSVLKNVRSGLMPPADHPRIPADELRTLEDWVKRGPLGIDPADPDPGRVTLRRLNRVEYRNTIRDLMGVEFNTEEEFPADDTGYGFDTIGDVLSVSPLLLEKYMQAAETIVTRAVPTRSRVVPSESLAGASFKGEKAGQTGARLNFGRPAKVARTFRADRAGRRRLVVTVHVDGPFEFDKARCRLVLTADDDELLRQEYGWQDDRTFRHEIERDWTAGSHRLAFALEPLETSAKSPAPVELRVVSVTVEGPFEKEHLARPRNFEKFFTADDPLTPEARGRYAREVLRKFTTRAYRRPVDDHTLDRLAAIAAETYGQSGKTVEEGVAQAMVAVLASPRFLFRVEEAETAEAGVAHPRVDEYALASRLSYFLWSTMPDDELFGLAARGELRKNLDAQVKRMLEDSRSDMLVRNFTGQWLQARDVETTPVDARMVLARDSGDDKELKREQEELRALIAQREAESRKAAESQAKNPGQPPPKPPANNVRGFRQSGKFRRLFTPPAFDLDEPLRRAMRRETEMCFAEVVRKDRSVLELLDADYTFLNEKLAKFYGVPGVTGSEMRKVSLPKGSPRGGVITQGTVLVVTSNPTRTSPVKRGLFVLDNILGTPAPPAPPSVPQLEDSEKAFKDHEPTLREVLEIHRRQPLCNACHARMDPLGLALENFNAMGLYREKERGRPLDTGGRLLTGETFGDVRTMKSVLKDKHRGDFYRCLTEKLFTYALGRGLEPTDVEAVDRVVARLEKDGGKFSALLAGVIESPPFQKRRNMTTPKTRAVRTTAANPETAGGPR